MKKIFKRFGAMFLVVAMLVAMLPMTVLAGQEGLKKDEYYISIEGKGEVTIAKIDKDGNSSPVAIKDGIFEFNFGGGQHKVCTEKNSTSNVLSFTVKNPQEKIEGTLVLTPTPSNVVWQYKKDGVWQDFPMETQNSEAFSNMIKVDGIKAVFPSDTPEVKILPTLNGSLTYNFRDQELITAPAEATPEDATVYYAIGEDNETVPTGEGVWTSESNEITGKDAGTYYVWYKAVNGNAESTPAYVGPVEIKPLEIPVYWFNDNNFTYDGTTHRNPTAISFWNLAGTRVTLKSFNENEEAAIDKTLEDAGTYVFEATSTHPNFVFSKETSTTTVKVSKATFAVVWPRKTYVYNDKVQEFPEVTLLGLGKKPEKVEVSIEKYKGREARRRTKFEDAGTYLLKATSTNPNYNLINDTKEYEIYKALVELPKAAEGLVYNGKEQTGVEGKRGLYRVENGKATNAGKYEAKVKLVDSDNYQWILGRGKFSSDDQTVSYTIAKNELDITDFRFDIPDDTDYRGRPVEAQVKLARKYDGRRSGNELEVWYENEEGKTVKKPVVPGTYKVMATIKGSHRIENFEGDPVNLGEFTINGVEITEGDGSVYTKGSEETLKFVSNGPFKAFKGIKVDGHRVDKDNYVAEAGSTVVTFNEDYAESLSEGKHEIVFVFGDRHNPVVASGTFTVKAAEAPNTGDESNLLIWIVMGSLAFLTMLGAAYTILRKDN